MRIQLRSRYTLRRAVGIVCASALFTSALATANTAGEPIGIQTRLPGPLDGSAAVWTGNYAYIFGGHDGTGPSDAIYRYDHNARSVTKMSGRLPSPRSNVSAVWTGTVAFIFGGEGTQSEIVRYDPTSDTAALISTRLPYNYGTVKAVMTGNTVHLLGALRWEVETGCDTAYGTGCTYEWREQYRLDEFDPSTGGRKWVGTPSVRDASLLFDGQSIFLFGGLTGSYPTNAIYQYLPALQEFRRLTATTSRSQVTPVWTSKGTFLITDRVFEFDPVSDAVRWTPIPAANPGNKSALFDGSRVFTFGGTTDAISWFYPDDATKTLRLTPPDLPTGSSSGAAAAGTRGTYIVGGLTTERGFDEDATDSILKYDPDARPSDGTLAEEDRVEKGPLASPPRAGMSLVWTGSKAYLFGGYDYTATGISTQDPTPYYSNEIREYNPQTKTSTLVGRLPIKGERSSAFWDGESAYVIGGLGNWGLWHLNDIVRFRPSTGKVENLAVKLPEGLSGTSVVWAGSAAYIFGGQGLSGLSSKILKFDPASQTISLMSARLPGGTYRSGAFWDGRYAYVVGGDRCIPNRQSCPNGYPTSAVIRYDPEADTTTQLPNLGRSWCCGGLAWDGTTAFLTGGHAEGDDGTFTSRIFAFSPSKGFSMARAELPSPRANSAAFYDGSSIHIIGGSAYANRVADWLPEAVVYHPGYQIAQTFARATPIATKLPHPLQRMAYASNSEKLFLLGGRSSAGRSDEILTFDMQSETLQLSSARLPGPREGASASYLSGSIYSFGGTSSAGPLDEIVQYNTSSDSVTVMQAKIPTPRSGSASVSDGRYVYLIGGIDAAGWTSQILRYDPISDQISVMNSSLPAGTVDPMAIWDGSKVRVFGGCRREILGLDPISDSLTTIGRLPVALSQAATVWTGSEARVIGGRTCNDMISAHVFRYP